MMVKIRYTRLRVITTTGLSCGGEIFRSTAQTKKRHSLVHEKITDGMKNGPIFFPETA